MKMRHMALGGLLFSCLALVGCGKDPDKTGQLKPKTGKQNSSAGEPSKDELPKPSVDSGTSARGDTPQAIWEAVKTANAAGDHKAFIESFSPAAQKAMVALKAQTALRARFMTGGSLARDLELKSENKPILDALDKHGLTAEATKGFKPTGDRKQYDENLATLTSMIKDPVALWIDLQNAFAKLPGRLDRPSTEYEGKLTDVKIEGNKATATHVQQMPSGQEVTTPIAFTKIEGKWKLAPELRSTSEK